MWPEAQITVRFFPGGTVGMISSMLHHFDGIYDIILVHIGTNDVHCRDGTPNVPAKGVFWSASQLWLQK